MSRFVAAYDVSDDNQRQRIARILERFGMPVQRSVFEVWLDADEQSELRRLVGPLLAGEDQFEIIPIDHAPHRSRWRWGGPGESYDPVIVVGQSRLEGN